MDEIEARSCRIAIIGGGLGGFAVGIALLQHGFTQITVYEQDAHMNVRRQGYGLTILQGISALKRLGLFDQVLQEDTPSRSHFIFHKNGDLIGFFGTGLWGDSCQHESKKHNLHIQRQRLRKIMIDRYILLHPNGEEGIKWNCQLLNIDVESRCISFLNIQDVYGVDLVIGADGINSRTRKFRFDPMADSKLEYLGIIVVLGITAASGHFLTHERVFQTLDGTFRLFAMPFSKTNPSQALMWQLSFPIDLVSAKYFSLHTAELKQYVYERCKDWHSPIPDMIEKTPLDLLMGIPAFDRDLDIQPTAVANNYLPIVLIGDAAHPMSPFKGQGANQVLLDAVELADIIKKGLMKNNLHTLHSLHRRLFSSVSQFEERMIKRVKVKVKQSHERVMLYHQESALEEENFFYRGITSSTMHKVRDARINAYWTDSQTTIEEALSRILSSQNSLSV